MWEAFSFINYQTILKNKKVCVTQLYTAAAKSLRLCATPQTAAHQAPPSLSSPGKNPGAGTRSSSSACTHAKSLSRVWLCATPWMAAHQAPLPLGLPRQELWSGRHSLLQSIVVPVFYSPCIPSFWQDNIHLGWESYNCITDYSY